MHKWWVLGVTGILFALPAWAQQKDGVTSSMTTESAAAAGLASANAASLRSSASIGGNSEDAWLSAARPRLFALPGAAAQGEEAPGRLWPRYEVAGMYDYLDFHPGDPFDTFGSHGGSGSFAYNATKYLGLTAELGGYHFQRNVSGSAISGGLTSYLFGPRLNLRRFNHFVPFAEFLVGGTHASPQVIGGQGQNAFAMAGGGGVDVVLTKNVAWRFAQLDYLMTNHTGSALGAVSRQNNFRAGTGMVFRWGFPAPPPPPNHPPVAACSVSPASVYAGSNETVAVHVNASDPDNDPLTYAYTATGGTVEGSGPEARWNTTGLAVGNYTVNVKVDDGKGGSASCAADLKVEEKPNHPPVISCAVERSPILPGERTKITATASDPDNDPLSYNWSAPAGQIVGAGAVVEFDSTGLQPGSYAVKGAVNDGRGGTAECNVSVDLQQPPPPPQAVKVGDCGYSKVGSSRFDNACKRVGDDVALRLNNEPNAKLVIVGYADAKEPRAEKLAATRADLAKKYIVEKGIDASRISTRVGEGSREKGQEAANRRVDFVMVPEGATY